MCTVSECAFSGGMPTMGGNGKAFCDGGGRHGEPIELVALGGVAMREQIAQELAAYHAAEEKRQHRSL